MTLKFEVESLDAVPEEQKGLYQEQDGKFRLAIDGLPKPEDTEGLKTALQREREKARLAEKYEKTGLTPDQIAEIQAEKEAAEQKKLEEKGNFEAILKQHREKWDTERGELSSQVEKANQAVTKHVVNGSLIAALAHAGATEEGLDLLPEKFAGRIEADLSGDAPALKFMAADGVTPMAGKGPNGLATLEEFVADIAEKYPGQFKSNVKNGGGKPPNAGGGGTHTGKKFEEMNGDELTKLLKDNPQEYERLKNDYHERI